MLDKSYVQAIQEPASPALQPLPGHDSPHAHPPHTRVSGYLKHPGRKSASGGQKHAHYRSDGRLA